MWRAGLRGEDCDPQTTPAPGLQQPLDPPAVYRDRLPGDVARALRRQEGGERRELFRLAKPPHRNLLLEAGDDVLTRQSFLGRSRVGELFDALGARVTRQNVVDGDAFGR